MLVTHSRQGVDRGPIGAATSLPGVPRCLSDSLMTKVTSHVDARTAFTWWLPPRSRVSTPRPDGHRSRRAPASSWSWEPPGPRPPRAAGLLPSALNPVQASNMSRFLVFVKSFLHSVPFLRGAFPGHSV